MTGSLKLALAQFDACVGAFESNTAKIIGYIRENRDADIVVFPSSLISGSPLENLAVRPRFQAAVEERLAEIQRAVTDISGPAVIVGALALEPKLSHDNPFFFLSGAPHHRVFCFLPGLRHHKLAMMSGPGISTVVIGNKLLAVGLAEDMYAQETARIIRDIDPDATILIGALPYERTFGHNSRIQTAKSLASKTNSTVVVVNLVGGQDELVFDGGSFIIGENAQIIHKMARFREDAIKVTLPVATPMKTPTVEPDLPPEALDYLACVTGLRAYVEKNQLPGVIIGMSGGMDSALACAMAVDAVGPSRVHAITLPSPVTSRESIEDAFLACEALGIRAELIPIAATVRSVRQMLGIDGRSPTVTEENIQARVRMIALMGKANERGELLIATSNKSEAAVGYTTLHGDMAGGFNPIKHLYKTEVWALARYRNANRLPGLLGPSAPIPTKIIEKPPSAELASGQTDEAHLGPYPVLDAILHAVVDWNLDGETALESARNRLDGKDTPPEWAAFLNLDHVKKIGRMVRASEFKRRLAAPGVILDRSFFHGPTLPMTNHFTI